MVRGCAQWSAALTQPASAATCTHNQHARARTHLELLSDAVSLPVLHRHPSTGACGRVGSCCHVVALWWSTRGGGRKTATRIVPKPWQLATNGFHYALGGAWVQCVMERPKRAVARLGYDPCSIQYKESFIINLPTL